MAHCLVKCKSAADVWNKIFSWWNIAACNFDSVNDIVSHDGNASLSLASCFVDYLLLYLEC